MKKRQCKSKEWFKEMKCQGCSGHNEPHWAFDECGSLILWHNKKDKSPEWKVIACKWIPPDHKNWISPVDMIEKSYIYNK